VGEKRRADWVDGEVQMMAAVSIEHGTLVGRIGTILRMFVEALDAGTVNGPEFMVRPPRQRRRRLPDLLFLSKDCAAALRPDHLEGAPDLIVECVSPDSVARDRREEYNEYERAGGRQYWVIDRGGGRMEGYAIAEEGRKYKPIPLVNGRLVSGAVGGFFLKPDWLLGETTTLSPTAPRELGILK
jgi:Uma2 family endonuclease